jgi:hypothetical protein
MAYPDGASLTAVFSTPLMLPVPVAGALAVLFVVVCLFAVRRAAGRVLSLTIVSLLIGTLALFAVLDRMTANERVLERNALMARDAELAARALDPASALACLDGAAGDAVESACEKKIFASPQSAAAAVAYVTARLSLLADGMRYAGHADPAFAAKLTGMRRAIELDRFGIAAQVLVVRDGCTADRCAAFALLSDANALQANLKAHVFDQYVSRYVEAWNETEPAAKQPQASTQPPVASATEPPVVAGGHPASAPFDFPSAASIPPVSIMNPEPKASREPAAEAPADASNPRAELPLPPKRPQAQAAGSPAR